MKLRSKRLANGGVELKILIDHPMESGRRVDDVSGQAVPAHYLTHLSVALNDKIVSRAELGTAIARNPYFAFRLRECKTGDRIQVSWEDNRGGKDSLETRVEAGL